VRTPGSEHVDGAGVSLQTELDAYVTENLRRRQGRARRGDTKISEMIVLMVPIVGYTGEFLTRRRSWLPLSPGFEPTGSDYSYLLC
jgi:hypothetical protein